MVLPETPFHYGVVRELHGRLIVLQVGATTDRFFSLTTKLTKLTTATKIGHVAVFLRALRELRTLRGSHQ
jgi:hypothetical protein